MEKKSIVVTLVVALLAVGGLVALSQFEEPSEYPAAALESLANCLTDNGAKMYGAYWCSHCQAQKRDFGEAVELMPFVECASPDSDEQAPECSDAGITNYPTWEFADGGLIMGRVPLPQLAERAQCEFPGVVLEEVTENMEPEVTITPADTNESTSTDAVNVSEGAGDTL